MISREKLAQEYIHIVTTYYPPSGRLLRRCLVKVLNLEAKRIPRRHYYLGIYYPDALGETVLGQQDIFQEVAENMGLITVVFLNANHLVRDPLSQLKQEDIRFWLDLVWITSDIDLAI